MAEDFAFDAVAEAIAKLLNECGNLLPAAE
jgi:hypothetical protein